MSVFRSNKHLYVQVIDDSKMHTLASASTMQKPVSEEFDYSSGPTIVSQIGVPPEWWELFINMISGLVDPFIIERCQIWMNSCFTKKMHLF